MKDTLAPDIEVIIALAEAARAGLPTAFGPDAAEVRIVVQDWPDEATLDALEVEEAYDLTGLYEGVPLTERSEDAPVQPSTIFLYRRAILDEWAGRGNVTLGELVTHVTIHEFAHHFGWSDYDIAEIDRWWE